MIVYHILFISKEKFPEIKVYDIKYLSICKDCIPKEYKSMSITDVSIITVEKGSKTLSDILEDITIGEILRFTYDNSGNLSSVLVKSNNTNYTGGSQSGKITLSGSYIVDKETKTSSNEK